MHFGTRRNATVPGVTQPQQFVGHLNTQKFVGRIIPTFKDKVDYVLLLGVSAGSFGAALNFSMFQDSFGSVKVDAGAECRSPDGGGLINFANFLIKKHPNARLAMISSMQDEVIRLFYSMGVKDCANADTIDPVALTVTQILDPTIFFAAATYTDGLNDLRSRFAATGRFATYFLGGQNQTFHQHVFRPRFYESSAGSKSMAQFVTDFMAGRVEQVGP